MEQQIPDRRNKINIKLATNYGVFFIVAVVSGGASLIDMYYRARLGTQRPKEKNLHATSSVEEITMARVERES